MPAVTPIPAPPAPLLASRRHTVVFLAILAAVAAWGAASQQRFGGGAPVLSPGAKWAAYASVVVVQLLLLRYVTVGIRRNGRTLRDLFGDLSVTPRRVITDLLLAAGFLAASLVLSPLLGAALGIRADVARVIGPSGPAQTAAWILVCVAAGAGEELSFRGYLQGQFARVTPSIPAAVLLQAVVFAVAHAYQGWRPALLAGAYGLAFGALAAARKSLRPGILAHTLVDVVGGIATG
jgi:membrane protease YdiL (CAAX protease family)